MNSSVVVVAYFKDGSANPRGTPPAPLSLQVYGICVFCVLVQFSFDARGVDHVFYSSYLFDLYIIYSMSKHFPILTDTKYSTKFRLQRCRLLPITCIHLSLFSGLVVIFP